MNGPEIINKVIFAEEDMQLIKLWQWNGAYIYEDDETGVFIAELYDPNSKNGKIYSVINSDGEYISRNFFDDCDEFQDGAAIVFRENKGFGYINDRGGIIIEPSYEKAEDFYNGHAFVMKNGKWLLLNKNGDEFLLPEKYKKFGVMSNNRCRVSTIELCSADLAYYTEYNNIAGIWGYIDECGREVILPQYIYADDFDNGLAIVCKGEWKEKNGKYWHNGELWGVIDTNGKEVIPCRYDDITTFDTGGGIFKVHTGGWKNGKWGVMNGNGKWIAPPIFNNIGYDYQDGLFAFYEDRNVPGDNVHDVLFGVYDIPNQKVLFEPQFTDIDFLDNGLFCVETVDACGNETEHIIDRSGNKIFNSDYTSISFENGMYTVCRQQGEERLYGLTDINGNVVLSCNYKAHFGDISLKDNNMIFEENGYVGVADFEGNVLVPAEYQRISRLAKHLFCVRQNYMFYGIVSDQGKIVLPVKYRNIAVCRNNRIIANGKNGVEVFEIKNIS